MGHQKKLITFWNMVLKWISLCNSEINFFNCSFFFCIAIVNVVEIFISWWKWDVKPKFTSLLWLYKCFVCCLNAIVDVYDNLFDDEHTSECKQTRPITWNESTHTLTHLRSFFATMVGCWSFGAVIGLHSSTLQFYSVWIFLRYFSFHFDSFDGVFYPCNQINFSFLSSHDPIT